MNKFMRQIFAAESEVSGLHQKGMFFNEAEAETLGAAAQPAQEEVGGEDDKAIAVPATSVLGAVASRSIRPCRARS